MVSPPHWKSSHSSYSTVTQNNDESFGQTIVVNFVTKEVNRFK